jgi:uncharacterized protein (DUF697 family)
MFLSKAKYLLPKDDRYNRIQVIVHTVSLEAAAIGAATAQIPGDKFIIGGFQVEMIMDIASEFGVVMTKSAASALFQSAIASVIGPQIAAGIVKYVPLWGNVVNASVAAAITETIGWATYNYFDMGESLTKK